MATNPSKTALETAAKYSDPTRIVSGGGGDFGGGGAGGSWEETNYSGTSDAGGGRSSSAFSAIDPRRLDLKVPEGAEAEEQPPTVIQTFTIKGKKLDDDMRVKIRVPDWYFTGLTSGYADQLRKLGGILFPYTPSISYDIKADYSPQHPLHSNFVLHFYQKSSIGSISISGKFTVENQIDAENYFATVHLLRALTRMKFGTDPDAGSPPPVCRLDAYGDMMMTNVPVVITSYRVDLPEDVDYFVLQGTEYYGKNAAPTRSTIQISCLPMYSRNEMQGFSVKSYISSRDLRGFI